jgi:hypothetical protein
MKTKTVIITGRVMSNNGDVAVLELTDDNITPCYRGNTPGFYDLFRDEFSRILPVGERVTAKLRDGGVIIEPCEPRDRFVRSSGIGKV